ncbi:membrane fusion protein (multidrug efflux system) [Caballeronia udeis]|uniref:Membrane fusion protein (Multidrug efflux system) n=1 Tax=Caballeronia udeis TaxID=1232866 RepID=A0ABW8MUR4_9BURK
MNKLSTLRVPLLCLGVIAVAACSKSGPPPAPPPPQVGVVTVAPQSTPLTKNLVGRLSAYMSANVTARVSGVLIRRAYKEGGAVKKGQLLFEIDPTFYQTALNNSLATLAGDQATYANDRVTAERNHKLLPVGSVSQQTVDNSDATVRTDAAKVKADQASVQSARINLGYTKVVSPIDGIASQQQVTEGAVVGSSTSDAGSSGTSLTTVDQIDSLYVNFSMSAADLVTLRQAQGLGNVALSAQDETKVQIVLPNGTAYDQSGTLDFSDVAVSSATGSVSLRARVPNPQHQLLPGMYVTLDVNLGQQHNVFLVPQQALQRDTAGAYVLVVGPDGKVKRKTVETRDSYRNNWIVTNGLDNGDQVVVTGLQAVQVGGQAKPVPWQSPSAASNGSNAPQASADHA